MFSIMKENNGVGLAAPQCGNLVRIFIMGDDTRQFNCINPELFTQSDEKVMYKEGCLSFPGLYMNILRPKTITCRWFDENGKEHQERFHHLWSRVFQHEIDHLDGINFQQRVSRLKLSMAEKKRKKYARPNS